MCKTGLARAVECTDAVVLTHGADSNGLQVVLDDRQVPGVPGVDDAGYEGVVRPWDAFWGQRYATVLDPDGNAVDLFAALPAS